MTGEDQPRPGMEVFQETLLVSFQRVGTLEAKLWPWPEEPRHSGQATASMGLDGG